MPEGTEVAALLVRIQTIGDKEAKAALAAIDASGKQAATGGLATAERASSRLSESVLGTTGEMKKLGREMTASAGEALGFGKAAGALGSELAELGPIGIGVAAAITGLVLIHKELNRVEDETKGRAEATADALLKQKRAADAATVAGARLALQQAQSVAAGTSTSPGLLSVLKVGALTALGGIGIGGKEAAEESILFSQRRKDATDKEAQAEQNLARAIAGESEARARYNDANLDALATLIKLGNATAGERAQAIAKVAELRAALNALSISDTIGRAGLAGQIHELNEALFPKLHKHVEKLLSELLTLKKLMAETATVTPSGDPTMASAQGGGVVATESVFGKMPNVKESEKTKALIDAIAERTGLVGKALTKEMAEIKAKADLESSIFGDALQNGLIAAFNGEGVGGAIAAFGKTILSALGQIFVQQGEALLSYGLTMTGLIPGFSNPITAGPAAIAAGAAFIALGATFGAIASGQGHGGAASSSSVANVTEQTTRLRFVNRDGSFATDVQGVRPVNYQITIIGEKDPQAGAAIQRLLDNNARRG